MNESGCQPKTFILMVKRLKTLYFSEKTFILRILFSFIGQNGYKKAAYCDLAILST